MSTLPAFRTGRARAEFGHVKPIDELEIPFAIIEGAEPGPCLLITAGVHGSEFCSIEAAVRIMKIRPAEIRGTLVVLPILNVEAFHNRNIYIMPQDGKNLNRQFPGRPDGSVSERLAHWLSNSVYPEADAYIDMHGGDLDETLEPFTVYPAADERSKALAAAFGIRIAVASSGVGYTVDAAFKAGIPGILPEMSGNGLWNDETVGRLTNGVHRVMAHLGMTDDDAPAVPADFQPVTMWVPTAPVKGLWYAAREPTEPVAKGDLLGEIKDVFGKLLASIHSEADGFILYRLTSLSVNQGEALIGVGTPL